ncbi:MAG: hypothetical protein KC931_27315 [Candidatus Omnitrophica bacterium]|nr:hypothetical protein [Candidatus Omnitrophota bacterium]
MLRFLSFLIFLSFGTLAESALGCAVCFGAEGHAMTEGMNMGILVLLGFVVTVLGGFAAFIGYLMYRSNHPLEIASEISGSSFGN